MEPEGGVQGLRPVRLGGEDVVVKGAGFGCLALGFVQAGGPQQGLEVGAVALAGGGCAGVDGLQDRGTLCGHVSDGLVHTLFGQDAGHLLEDIGGRAATSISAKDEASSSMRDNRTV